MAKRGRDEDRGGDRAQTRERKEHEGPDAHLPARQPRHAFRVDEDLTHLQAGHERRRHARAVALEELDQVEVSADRNDQLRALFLREQ